MPLVATDYAPMYLIDTLDRAIDTILNAAAPPPISQNGRIVSTFQGEYSRYLFPPRALHAKRKCAWKNVRGSRVFANPNDS